MVVVTGTKRSGTSMWMQVLQAAGLPVIGEDFPMRWGEGLRDANPGGFYESTLRSGIYHATNPDPQTGRYLHPVETRDVAVKVFLPGLVRSDHAFLNKVVFTVRDWRAYVRSIQRLESMDRPQKAPRVATAAALEWWTENFIGLRDLLLRRYPCQMLSYETAVENPKIVVPQLLSWLGRSPPWDEAIQIVDGRRTTASTEPLEVELPDGAAGVFDAFCACVREGAPLTEALLTDMNELHTVLAPMAIEYARAAALGREAGSP